MGCWFRTLPWPNSLYAILAIKIAKRFSLNKKTSITVVYYNCYGYLCPNLSRLNVVVKLKRKCLNTRRIANSTKVQTRHRGQPISSGLLICVFVQAFGDAFEFTQVAVHFLCI